MTFRESDGVTPKPLANTIVKFAASRNAVKVNPRADVWKTSYTDGGLLITDAPNGVTAFTIEANETSPLDPSDLCTAAKLFEYGASVVTGTIDLAPSADDFAVLEVTGSLVDVKEGYVLIPAGANPRNTEPVTIESVDLVNNTIKTDFLKFSDELAVAFAIHSCSPVIPTDSLHTIPLTRMAMT